MTDIVERLRKVAPKEADYLNPPGDDDPFRTINRSINEAADEIERLRGIREEMARVLEKVAGGFVSEIERLRAQVVSLQSSLDAGPPKPGKKTPDALEPKP